MSSATVDDKQVDYEDEEFDKLNNDLEKIYSRATEMRVELHNMMAVCLLINNPQYLYNIQKIEEKYDPQSAQQPISDQKI